LGEWVLVSVHQGKLSSKPARLSRNYYWLIKDPGSGLDIYRSPALNNWTLSMENPAHPKSACLDRAAGGRFGALVRACFTINEKKINPVWFG
jgi:hypothetical protein